VPGVTVFLVIGVEPMLVPSRRIFAAEGVDKIVRVAVAGITGFFASVAVTVFVPPACTVKEVL